MSGSPITMENGILVVPNNPIGHYIEGDGIGVDITPVMIEVVDAAVDKAYSGSRAITWSETLAGEKAFNNIGEWLPEATLDAMRTGLVSIKGPLTTPVGGGIRSLDDIRDLLNAGTDKVSINSAACEDPEFVRRAAERFGSQCIVVNIDPKRVYRESAENGVSPTEVWEVHIHGGRTPTGLTAVSWAQQVQELGAGEIVLTSMDCDGTKDGYDLEITQAVSDAVSIPVVASGGAGQPSHLADAILLGHADAALAASIFHFGEYTITET